MVILKLAGILTALAVFSSLVSGAPASALPKRTPPLAWVFQTHRDPQTNPHTDVFLRVGARQVLVMRQATDEFQTVPRREYAQHGFPAKALAACNGWWAGQGDDLYVVRRGQSLVVFRREEDEQSPTLPWKRLKVIPLP